MDENRRWFRFGTRDLLWAMVALGLIIGWWQEYWRRVEASNEAIAWKRAFDQEIEQRFIERALNRP